ncbi:hypothetical protein LINPERHAP2_LOCUS37486, partial [Linum perenne]
TLHAFLLYAKGYRFRPHQRVHTRYHLPSHSRQIRCSALQRTTLLVHRSNWADQLARQIGDS